MNYLFVYYIHSCRKLSTNKSTLVYVDLSCHASLTASLIIVALCLNYSKILGVNKYHPIFIRLLRLGNLHVDNFVTGMIERAYSMVETERVHQNQSDVYNTLEGKIMKWRLTVYRT